MMNLNNVTLLGIDGLGNDLQLAKAIKYSQEKIKFGKTILFSATDDQYDFCETIKINKLSYEDCQKFTMTNLVDYIETDYILLVQSDGFIVNPDSWSDDFFSYDYIGAPWPVSNLIINNSVETIPGWHPQRKKVLEALQKSNYEYQVGNGGFTFRSKKLLSLVKEKYSEKYANIAEDGVICICMRKELESEGIKFCPLELSGLFSCESKVVNDVNNNIYKFDSDASFGFHCKESHPDKIKLLEKVLL